MHPLDKFRPIAEAIAALFAPQTEVVIHELASDRIHYIANSFSGRKVGDESMFKLDKATEELTEDVIGPYEKAGDQGQRLVSITAALRAENGDAIGLMCINADYSRYEQAFQLLEGLLGPRQVTKHPEILFRNDWQDMIRLEIRQHLAETGQSLTNLHTGLRKELIERIEGKGLLYAKKSAEQLAAILSVSRATVYKDLAEIRNRKQVLT